MSCGCRSGRPGGSAGFRLERGGFVIRRRASSMAPTSLSTGRLVDGREVSRAVETLAELGGPARRHAQYRTLIDRLDSSSLAARKVYVSSPARAQARPPVTGAPRASPAVPRPDNLAGVSGFGPFAVAPLTHA